MAGAYDDGMYDRDNDDDDDDDDDEDHGEREPQGWSLEFVVVTFISLGTHRRPDGDEDEM